MAVETWAGQLFDEAVGRRQRVDPALGRTGGPAGNARLTAWTGAILLVLIAVELITLLDVRGLISWHIVVGTVLLPLSLLKTGSTGWRIVRYYSGKKAYREAGPPVAALRILGPFVVGSTLILLASGVLLVLLGPTTSRTLLATVFGQRIDWVTVHQIVFLVWGVLVGVHILARLVPMWHIATGSREGHDRRAAGGSLRVTALLVTLAVAAASAAILLAASHGWRTDDRFGPPGGQQSHPGQAAVAGPAVIGAVRHS